MLIDISDDRIPFVSEEMKPEYETYKETAEAVRSYTGYDHIRAGKIHPAHEPGIGKGSGGTAKETAFPDY